LPSLSYISLRLKNGSQIKAVSSAGTAGRSSALSLLIVDECLGGNTTIEIRNKNTGEIRKVNISDLFNNNEYT